MARRGGLVSDPVRQRCDPRRQVTCSRLVSSHSVLAALVIGVIDAARAIGLDSDAILEEAGIDPVLLSDPDARVPLELDIRLWQILSRRPIGLQLGERLGLSGMGVVGYAMSHGRTVGEALDWLQRYRAVVHPDVVPRHERRREPAGERVVFSRPAHPAFARLREPVEAQAAALVSVMRALSGRDVRARHVTFPLPRPPDPERHERFFACPVAWAGPLFEVAFDASLLDLQVPRSDPHLFSYLARRADQLEAQLPSAASHADHARREVGELLASGDARLPIVAQRLGTSERTLHRRLADEGTSFAALVDEARRERATLLLEDRHLSCSEIAFLLGYAETAPFFRAFKRWTGMTPQAWRAARTA